MLTIATAFVVATNLAMAAGLLVAAVWVWRSRLPMRQFARDLERLELELRTTLPPLPEQLAESCDRLRDLNDRHQIAIARLTMARQASAIAQRLWGRWLLWRRR